MAFSLLLRSAGRSLRRSVPPRSYPPVPAREDSFLFSITDFVARRAESGYKQAVLLFAAENPWRLFSSNCGGKVDPNEKQFSEDDLKEFNRYLRERTKQAERNMYLCLDKSADACENRSRPLRNIKAMLEARNNRSAQKYLLVKQWAVLISYSVFALALHNLHLFS